MTIAYRFMQRHTRNTLVARGWPANMDIDTSLNYSRGEGVAFYGQLDALQLQRLLPEIALCGLMSDQAMKMLLPLLAGSELVVRLYRNSLGHRKAHAGTISLEYDNCPDGMSTKHILCLLKALRDEINHVCSCVASAGYRLMEALRPAAEPLVFTRRTRNFPLTVTEVEQVQDDAQWDNETLDARLNAVLDGKETFRRLQICLECNGRTVGQTHVTDLIKSPLNVRTMPYTTESVKQLANSIESLGLLHNLVVHALPEGKYGVAAGGRRLTALTLMSEMGRIKPDYQVPVKRVSDELAVEASYAENNEIETMHSAEQITAFGTLAAQGKTPAQIGEVLGYGSRHVQRMLKLASLAPSLLALLAEGQLDVEQCQVLCLESDPERQVAVYESVKEELGRTTVNALKNRITESEISVSHPRFAFIGREVYEAAGGIVREDLFSEQEGDGTVDSLLVERLVLEKLELIAKEIHQKEGWMWSTGRLAAINLYGPDGKYYRILPEPDAIYSEDDIRRIDELSDKFNALDPDSYEAEAISSEISLIEHAAELRGWTEDLKAKSGVVVSFMHSALRIQRGICRMSDLSAHAHNLTLL